MKTKFFLTLLLVVLLLAVPSWSQVGVSVGLPGFYLSVGNFFGYPQERVHYYQRIGITEPVFANIRVVKGLDRFTLRGKIKVNIQWVLYCMVHNIGKIMSYRFA
jgi:Transposase DDE domain